MVSENQTRTQVKITTNILQEILGLIRLCSSVDANGRSVIKLSKLSSRTTSALARALRKLKSILLKIGCFDFYATNSGYKVIGVSQVVYYIYHGYKGFNNGQVARLGFDEVNHIDGDVSNNHPDNLIMLSPTDHRVLSKAQEAQYSDFEPFIETVCYCPDSTNLTQFNRQGKRIKDHARFMRYWTARTLIVCEKWLAVAVKKGFLIKKIVDFCEAIIPSLDSSFDLSQFLNNRSKYSLGLFANLESDYGPFFL